MPPRIGIIGCGSIGSLYAAHLASVAEVHAFVRRPEHARALNENPLRVTGTHNLEARIHATTIPRNSPIAIWASSAAKPRKPKKPSRR